MGLHVPERILRQKNYELLAEAMQARIVEGELAPGDELPPERALMESYGVGRSSVREALRILESRGLIAKSTGGFQVAHLGNPLGEGLRLVVSLNALTTLQLFEVRETLEVAIAGHAAARRGDADLAEMRAAIDVMVESLSDLERHVEADLAFHAAVAHATGNPLYEHVMAAVRDALRHVLRESYVAPPAERAVDDHRQILAAIEAGDSDGAREAMARHLDNVRAAFA